MNTTVEQVELIKINVDKSTISFKRNGLTASVKFIYYGSRCDLTATSAFNAYVVFNKSVPIVSFLTLKEDIARMIEQRNNNFFCGIVG